VWSDHTIACGRTTGHTPCRLSRVTSAQPYLRVIDDIEASIMSGALSVGDRLESERALAERLGVSRSSVREAIRTLSTLGPQAGAILISDVELGWTSALRLHVAMRSLPVGDVVRTRAMLEAGAYRDVEQAVPRDRLAAAHELIAVMDASEGPQAFHRADLAFHLELVQLSGNTVAALLLSSLRNAIEGYVAASFDTRDDWGTVAIGLQGEHRELVAALEAGDGERAASCARHHILGFARRADLL
jgi:GntR family transcriptional repressor for pyruvate dehydrogenase complex